MISDPRDTIVALSSAPGAGGRAVIRLSGPEASSLIVQMTTPVDGEPLTPKRLQAVTLAFPGIESRLDAELIWFEQPRSYTGQDVIELHLLSIPPLLEIVVAELLRLGARAAGPGEFTLRAFLAGKLDLPRAEAVLGIIEADSRSDLRQALTQHAGGLGHPLDQLRDELLDLLAEVEAGLDFAEEDLHFVEPEVLLQRLTKALALLTLTQKQLEQRGLGERPFRVVLSGRPNAGKSSLFNALAGANAIVSPEPGTTRDYLVRRFNLAGVVVELIDTAGRRPTTDPIEHAAQAGGSAQAADADLVLVCIPAGAEPDAAERDVLSRSTAVTVATKCDLATAPPGVLATSVVTRFGLDEVRAVIEQRIRDRKPPSLAPSLSRCRSHVERCLRCLRQAHAAVLYEETPEILAVELRGALDELGEMVGAVYTDDLLDRIFSRFCIGK